MAATVTRFISCCGAPIGGGNGGAGGIATLDWDESIELSALAIEDPEVWLREISLDFDKLAASILLLEATLTALTRQVSSSGIYRIRMDGTPGSAADGTVLCTLTTTHNAGYVLPPDIVTGAAFARPAGAHLLKLTGESGDPEVPVEVWIKSFQLVVSEA